MDPDVNDPPYLNHVISILSKAKHQTSKIRVHPDHDREPVISSI